MMSRLLGLAALVAAFFLVSAQAAFADKRVALVIGNSAYKNVVQLPNPSRDASAVADMLRNAGFDVVETKLDLNNTNMRRVIREFTGVARNADIAVVYYAGHGIEFDGTNYLIPVDAQLSSDVDVEDEAISIERIMRMLEPVKRLRLIILDACRENPFAKKMTRTVASRSIGRGLGKIEVTSTDTLVAFAAKAGMTAADGSGEHSPFTAALLDNLATPGLDLRIAFGKVRDEVMASTDSKQEPFVYGSIGGSTIALVPKKEEPAAKVAAAAAQDTLARDYEFAERVGTREAWESFLSAHSNGFFANLARAAVNKITVAEQQLRLGKDKAAEEELKRKAAEATQLKASEEARLKAEANAKRFAEEEAKLKAKLDAFAKTQQEQKMVVASAPGAATPEAKRGVTPGIDQADIASLLQFHLQRVGCDPGALDGQWTDKSAAALDKFNKREKTSFDVKVASLSALDAVKQQKGRVCAPQCSKGFKAAGDRCVAEACKRGFVRNKAGDCEHETKAAAHPTSSESGGGQIFCAERGGCQTVPKNCHIAQVSQGGTSGGTPASGGMKLVCN
jgi:uncharacterized caspase-like protein